MKIEEIRKMSKKDAEKFVSALDEMPESDFKNIERRWMRYEVADIPGSYIEFRNNVLEAFKRSNGRPNYDTDLFVGLCLYKELSPDNGFNNIMANDDDVWRYLSCIVFPDITYLRYPKTAKCDIRINRKRFYSHTRRIWVKTLWWYIHLSWQGDENSTFATLNGLGADTISDLIERPGKGYRLPLTREIMKHYAETEQKSTDVFNRIQKQNLVNCKTQEPALGAKAEDGYVERLFNQLSIEVYSNDRV